MQYFPTLYNNSQQRLIIDNLFFADSRNPTRFVNIILSQSLICDMLELYFIVVEHLIYFRDSIFDNLCILLRVFSQILLISD